MKRRAFLGIVMSIPITTAQGKDMLNTAQGKDMLNTALEECAALRASLINRADTTTEVDAVAIATAFALEAANIYRALGGEKMVAAQFYALADAATNKP